MLDDEDAAWPSLRRANIELGVLGSRFIPQGGSELPAGKKGMSVVAFITRH